MKRLTQFVCLILIASMLLTIHVFAAEQASDFFAAHSCYLWEVSDSEFEACFNVTAVDAMDVLGASEIKVQRSANGSDWETVATYYDIYRYDRSYASGYVTYSSVTSGYYYRAKVTFYAENDSGIGEYTAYTSSLHY